MIDAQRGLLSYSGSGSHVVNGGPVGWRVDVSGTAFTLRDAPDLCDEVSSRAIVRLTR